MSTSTPFASLKGRQKNLTYVPITPCLKPHESANTYIFYAQQAFYLKHYIKFLDGCDEQIDE